MPLGLVLVRAMQTGREDELASRYRKSEWSFVLAAVVSQLGGFLSNPGRWAIGPLGIVVSAGGMLAVFWLLMKVAPAGSRHDSQLPTPADPGRGLE